MILLVTGVSVDLQRKDPLPPPLWGGSCTSLMSDKETTSLRAAEFSNAFTCTSRLFVLHCAACTSHRDIDFEE